jgi:hypothetical protein
VDTVAMRKYILNAGVLSAAFSFFGLAKTTARGPRDWRLILMWVSALAGLAIAVGTVIEQSKEAEDY